MAKKLITFFQISNYPPFMYSRIASVFYRFFISPVLGFHFTFTVQLWFMTFLAPSKFDWNYHNIIIN